MNAAITNYDIVIFFKFNVVVSDCDINLKKINYNAIVSNRDIVDVVQMH